MSVSKLILVMQKVEQNLGHHNIRDVKVLAVLWTKPTLPISFQSLLKTLALSPVSLTRTLKFLQDQSVVELGIDTVDTRRKLVELTDKGKALKLDIIEIMEDTKK